MINPRSSNDPQVRAALSVWDKASTSWEETFSESMRIRTALRDTSSHHAYGWAALTSGRIAAYRGEVDLAEVLLTEALGRFCLVGDKYGEGMAMSHLAIPQVARRNLDRALELALAPLSSTAPFSDVDKSLLHNGVALCHWAREESHHAISHLIREFDLIRNANDFDRTSVVLGNMGVVLLVLGEWELALSISGKAWHLQLANCVDNKKLQVSQLVNIMLLNCLLGKYEAALVHGEWLYGRLSETREPSTWPHFLNLANAFSLNGRTKEARGCLGRARELNASIQTEFSIANLKAADATFHEAQKDFSSAIRLSKEVLDQPVHIVKRAAHLWSALVVSRSYRKLGRGKESNKWQEIANEIRHERPLGEIFASQIQASLRIEPLGDPLTEKEMACLVLSTRGQTSADIGLKLGITTRTVNFHFAKILRKLNASNRQEAIAKAVSANLLHASL